VIVLGPNGIDSRDGHSYHVHAKSCQDLRNYKGSEFANDKANPLDVNSVEEIAEYVYDFEDNPQDLVGEFYVFPCVHFEASNGNSTDPARDLGSSNSGTSAPEGEPMITVSFEMYTEDFWVSFEVETSEPNTLIHNLIKLKNTRNIHFVY